MGFNFRKSIKIAPGIKLNVSKNGISSKGRRFRVITYSWSCICVKRASAY